MSWPFLPFLRRSLLSSDVFNGAEVAVETGFGVLGSSVPEILKVHVFYIFLVTTLSIISIMLKQLVFP